jgi:hypothetical protein
MARVCPSSRSFCSAPDLLTSSLRSVVEIAID